MSDLERGQAIQRRRIAQGFKSERALEKASGVTRAAIAAAEKGKARGDTFARLEAFLDQFEHEVGEDIPTPTPEIQQATLKLEGRDVTMTYTGTPLTPDELEEYVRRFWRATHPEE